MSNVLDNSLERKLSDEKVSRSLVLSDLSNGDGSRSESVSLLDSSHRSLSGGLLAGVLSWLLDAGVRLSDSGFCSCHSSRV